MVQIKVEHGTFTVTIASPAVFTRIGHGLAIGDIVYLKTTGALPTGLAIDTAYYVIAAGFTIDAFEVSTSLGGAAVNTSGSQNGTHTLFVDRTRSIEYQTVSVSRALTSQVDTCKFDVVRTAATDWKPTPLDEVLVYEGTTVIFGGQIIEQQEEIAGGDVEVVHVTCKDYSFELDRQLVADTYENMTVAAIVQDIITNYTTGFTTTNVVAPPLVGFISFKYEYPSKCLQQLAELIGYDWYVDDAKDIHFFAKETNPAPFNLDDTGGKYYYDTLKISKDVKNLRNTIIVRGGEYEGSTITESQNADGEKYTFTWAYKYSNVVVKVAGATKTVGIDFIDDPTLFDCLYNFNEKAIKFPVASKPTAGQKVEITGTPHIPVIVRVRSPLSEAEYGAFEYKIVDSSIGSKQGARDRAAAELRGWADQIWEGEFETKEAGLEVGQLINVQSTKRSIDQDYVISRITSKLTNGNDWLHRVTLVTTQTFGMMEFLQMLLTQKDKEIKISADEVVDLVESNYETITVDDGTPVVSKVHNPQTETVTITETPTVQALNYAVTFGLDSFAPDGTKRTFILDGSQFTS